MIYEIIDTRTCERAKAYELAQEPWAEKTRGCDWPLLAVDETGDVMLTDDCGNYSKKYGLSASYVWRIINGMKRKRERPLTDAAWAELEKKIRGCVE